MSPVTAFPSAADAMATVRAGLRFLAAADATQLPVQTQAECLQMLEQADAISTAARASTMRCPSGSDRSNSRGGTGQNKW